MSDDPQERMDAEDLAHKWKRLGQLHNERKVLEEELADLKRRIRYVRRKLTENGWNIGGLMGTDAVRAALKGGSPTNKPVVTEELADGTPVSEAGHNGKPKGRR